MNGHDKMVAGVNHVDLRTPDDANALMSLTAMARELRNLGWRPMIEAPRDLDVLAISLDSPHAFRATFVTGQWFAFYDGDWTPFNPIMWRQYNGAEQRKRDFKPKVDEPRVPIPGCIKAELWDAVKPFETQSWSYAHSASTPDVVFDLTSRATLVKTDNAKLARYIYMMQPSVIKRLLQRIDFLEGRLP